MNAIFDIPAPAKLNLFLHIVGQRADGYHLLQSVFMLIDWHDTLHVERLQSNHITRTDIGGLELPTDDLCTRAAKALQDATGCMKGAHITLQKKIPHQAGLGGGSSDAASTLLALNKLWHLNLSKSALISIGLSLGADVPFFIQGHNAWVEGIGEKITPLPDAIWPTEQPEFIVVKPNRGIATSTIFSSKNLKNNKKTATIQGFAKQVFDFGSNDLEAVAKEHCAEMELAIDWLESFGLKPKMSGSGSAVFAKLTPIADRCEIIHRMPAAWVVKICKSLHAHPLVDWA